jgi:hypothetical protein
MSPQLSDRNGDPFTGTPAELKRHNNKLCKQASRAKADPVLSLPLPAGLRTRANCLTCRFAGSMPCWRRVTVSYSMRLLG